MAIFELLLASLSKRLSAPILSYEKGGSFTSQLNSFWYEWLRRWVRFDSEA